ncbi:hypothetical protein BZG36_04075 [Bifiguratus adelaidae]|uniref:Protein PET100, mitochondrial n=1 Tax=Bifiguratus adelaidae TaxID=1938954 RepID=A0A261XXW1_9FUNG|nr:hypothetical protein BZG36_04075 [Bifiguratus adelaidae]
MGGPNLEVVKFGIYVMFPIGWMLYFGGPEFFDRHVRNINFWPKEETTNKPPSTKQDIQSELVRLKLEREARWRRRHEQQAQEQAQD